MKYDFLARVLLHQPFARLTPSELISMLILVCPLGNPFRIAQ